MAHLRPRANIDMIVVDNNSEDETAVVACERGAKIVHEPMQGVARARNAGARHAEGDVLVFVDADVIVPPNLLDAIHVAMRDPTCVGGAVDVDYRPRRIFMRLYLHAWRLLARLTGMAQGATQFCRKCGLRTGGGIRREGVDRGGCRLLLGPQEVRQGERVHSPVHTKSARATFLPSLRQVADMESLYLDQPPHHRIVPPAKEGLERLVLACREVDLRWPDQKNDRHTLHTRLDPLGSTRILGGNRIRSIRRSAIDE